MTSERIRYNALGGRTPFFSAPDMTTAALPWTGLSFEEADGPNEPLPSHAWSKTTLLYVTSGEASLRWRHRGAWRLDALRRGTVSIVRRDAEIESAAADGAMRLMVLQLDSTRLEAFAPEDVLAIERSLKSAEVTQDEQLSALLSAMRAETRDGCRSGRLYAESVSTALLTLLAARYTGPGARPARGKGLSPAQKRKLIDHVRENLSGQISVADLAGIVGMSPAHFARTFKSEFGISPYGCVMRERVAKAKRLISDNKTSLGGVGADVGFASQSHFARVFRQFSGVTPKVYRDSIR